ncbi:MAG: hypothetical protein M9894_07890 [Planctomycetes bacterium]|nr:hypothetical protein [Planctomycetota bacterium]
MDEQAEFERAPRGWPPLDATALVVHGALLVPVLLLALAGGLSALGETIRVGASPWPLGLPVWLGLLGVVAAIEVLRVASFRSTVYVISPGRARVRRGIVSVRTVLELPLAGDVRVTLDDGDPCIDAETGSLTLKGLGAAELDAVRLALGLPAEGAPPAPARRRRGLVAVVTALALLAGAQAFGAVGNRARARFQALELAVGGAVATAEGRVMQGRSDLHRGGSRSGIGGILTDQRAEFRSVLHDVSRREPGQPRQPLTVATASVDCRMPWGPLVYGEPRVVVTQDRPGEANEELLRELRAAFAAAGIEATWPAER